MAAQLRNLLGASNRARVVADLTRRAEMVGGSERESSLRRGAVLVPFIANDGAPDGPELLFTVRSRTLRKHRGQVSFPGGAMDPTDTSSIHTALRETEEELGVPTDQWDVWGELPSFPDRVKGRKRFIISPVIATVPELPLDKLRLQKSEVDFVFTVPVSKLIIPTNRQYTVFKDIPIEFPVYLGGARRIWGITGFIIDYVLHTMIPSD